MPLGHHHNSIYFQPSKQPAISKPTSLSRSTRFKLLLDSSVE